MNFVNLWNYLYLYFNTHVKRNDNMFQYKHKKFVDKTFFPTRQESCYFCKTLQRTAPHSFLKKPRVPTMAKSRFKWVAFWNIEWFWNIYHLCRLPQLPDKEKQKLWIAALPPRKTFVIDQKKFCICERHWQTDSPIKTCPGGYKHPLDPPSILNVPPIVSSYCKTTTWSS